MRVAVQASATIDNEDIQCPAAVYGRRIAAQQRVRADKLGVAVMLYEEGGQE